MEPVALLNGIMMTTTSWALIAGPLSEHYRVVTHDFRGQLRNLMEGPFAMSQHVDDLAALLDAQGIESAHLVGTSYGGEVGMLFALAHPSRVRSLTLIACASHVEPALAHAVALWRDAAREAPETLYDVSAPYNFSPAFLTPALVEQGRARLGAVPPLFFRAFADLCDAFLALDVTPHLHEIRARTLVIAGELDVLKPPSYSRTIASRIPDARLEIIANAGHAVVIEKPAEVAALVRAFIG